MTRHPNPATAKPADTTKTGTWRLSNHKLTFSVKVDSKGVVVEAAPIASRFTGRHLQDVCRWMQNMDDTDIMLIRTKI